MSTSGEIGVEKEDRWQLGPQIFFCPFTRSVEEKKVCSGSGSIRLGLKTSLTLGAYLTSEMGACQRTPEAPSLVSLLETSLYWAVAVPPFRYGQHILTSWARLPRRTLKNSRAQLSELPWYVFFQHSLK